MGLIAKLLGREPAKAQSGNRSSWTHSGRNFWETPGSEAYHGEYTEPRRNGAVVACVQRIVSRALEVGYMSERGSTSTLLSDPSWVRSWDTNFFWRALYERVLFDGEAGLALADSGRLRVGRYEGVNRADGMGQEYTMIAAKANGIDEESIVVGVDNFNLVSWNGNGDRPYDVIRTEAAGYAECYDDLNQEARYARRIASEIEMNDMFADPDRGEEAIAQLTKLLRTKRKYLTPVLTRGMNYVNKESPESPPHKERISEALAGVARVYGVPLPLLMSGVERQTIEESDAHLLRDAVYPLVRSVAAALTRLLDIEVMPDLKRVGLPSKQGIAGYAMTMGQTGVFTINEIRAEVGFDEIEGGDEFPETAGAAEREQGSASHSPNGSNDEN